MNLLEYNDVIVDPDEIRCVEQLLNPRNTIEITLRDGRRLRSIGTVHSFSDAMRNYEFAKIMEGEKEC